MGIKRFRPILRRGRKAGHPKQRPCYKLDELLKQCNPKAARAKEDREWLEIRPVGRELI
jgi:antitoxin ChpS